MEDAGFMIYINAENRVVGRLASVVAKQLLNGERVAVVNTGKAVMLGNSGTTIKEFLKKRSRGDPYHGPFYPTKPDRIFKRVVRGMLPHKTQRGGEALKRLRAFVSVPADLQDKEFVAPQGTENKGDCKFITLEQLAERA
jgi:large subunit ribosomal protein L13